MIGQRIRQLRTSQKLSLRTLGRMVHKSMVYLKYLEDGRPEVAHPRPMLILLIGQALQTDLLPEAMVTFQMRIWPDLAPLLAYRLVASLGAEDLAALRESLAAAGHPLPEAAPEASPETSWESLSAVLEQLGPEASWKVLGSVVKQISIPFAIGPSDERGEMRLVLGDDL